MKFQQLACPIAVLAFFLSGNTLAAPCSLTPLTDASILSGRSVVAQSPSTGETWKEDHCANGDLYKIGDGTTADPRAYRGTWTDNNDGTVTYDYGSPATTYTWKLYAKSVNVGATLCWGDPNNNGEAIAIGTVNAITGSCP